MDLQNNTVIDLSTDKEYQKLLKQLARFAFHQKEKIGDLFPETYTLLKSEEHTLYHCQLKIVFKWLLIPSSLWPAEFIPIGKHLNQLVKAKKPLPPGLTLILKFASYYPPRELQALVKRWEHRAHQGLYDNLMQDNAHFLSRQDEVAADPELKECWETMKQTFDMASYVNDIGVVRRYMIGERGYRIGWVYDPADEESVMRTALTLLGFRFDLYGFQHDAPLVSKFTANPTGFGSVMMVPKYQSADLARDFNRKLFGEIPKAYGAAYKGAKAIHAKREREDEAIRTYTASLRAAELGLEGEARRVFIAEEAKLPRRTELRKIRKLIQMGRELLGVGK